MNVSVITWEEANFYIELPYIEASGANYGCYEFDDNWYNINSRNISI